MTEFEALLLSAAIEAPVAWLVVRLTKWPSRGPLHAAAAAAVATAVTHPQLWAAMLCLIPQIGWWPAALVGEGAVVLVEALLIAWMARMKPHHALALSCATNGASFAVGLFFAA